MTDRWTEDGRIMLFSVILTMRVSHVISLVKFRSRIMVLALCMSSNVD